MLIKKHTSIPSSAITSQKNFINRRDFIGSAALGSGAFMIGSGCAADEDEASQFRRLEGVVGSDWDVGEDPNPFEDIITYNNFYEFGLGKDDPMRYAGAFKPKPWQVVIEGEAEITGTFDYDDLIRGLTIEERVYRFRCVEAWSMIVPWNGFELAALLKRFKPTSRAKYVAFETVYRPAEMPGQRRGVLDFPYVEGLTIEEAMHPLTLMAIGVYGVELPNQNGAPLRLIVPWKYGFKSIKSIVKISFTEKEPPTTWSLAGPNEYGFYANVNPEVDHPRWSQARERRIGSGLFSSKIPTLMFNGYADEVAGLYKGLDLTTYF